MGTLNNIIRSNKWRFIKNGYGNEYSLDSTDVETFKKDPIASLARETCQNSIDARKGEHSVKVEFKAFELNTSEIPGIKELKNELIACRDSYEVNTKYYNKFQEMILEVEKEKIMCLRISDFYTKGLEGVGTNDRNKAFYYLTKGNGLTTKTNSSSGGSKGIGKFASFVASSLQTVFYSTLNEDNEKGYMGITKLASRLLNSETGMCTTGYGYFCRTEKVLPILEKFSLDKNFSRGKNDTGTDIYIIGFKMGENWKREIITKILDSFMCAIQFGDFEADIDGITLNKDTLREIVYNKEYINISERKNVLSQYILLNDKFVHTKEVNIKQRGIVKILLKDFNRQEEFLATNKCVMIRYPYMKITDFKIPFVKPCSAMCIIEKDELNSTLREVENPQHTDWETNRIEDPEIRKEVKRIIKQIKNEIQEFAKECLLDSREVEVDMEGAGDYLPDIEAINGMSEVSSREVIESPKIINKKRCNLKNTYGEKEEQNNNSVQPDIGQGKGEGNEGNVPDGHNSGTNGDVHNTNNQTGVDVGENIIMRAVNLGGLKSRVIVLDKSKGKYMVTFKSIYDENNCELELYYLDDNGNKYKPNINKCLINGLPVDVENNKVKNFEIKDGVKYNLELETDLDDLYACEVKIYANR